MKSDDESKIDRINKILKKIKQIELQCKDLIKYKNLTWELIQELEDNL